MSAPSQNDTSPIEDTAPVTPMPQVNKISVSDIQAALGQGLKDFAHAPLFGLFFGGIIALGGITVLAILTFFEQRWWILPFAVGFPLLGPFLAIGLYEVSRRLHANEPLIWGEVMTVVASQRTRQLPWIAFVIMFIFWVWIYQVRTLVALFAGLSPFATLADFFSFLGTTNGYLFLGVGSMVGAVMALTLFSVTVIGIPLLLDRDVDFMTAVITSVKTVFTSPFVMLSWGVVVTFLAMTGIATGFIGLFLLFPILGHATWHLYKRAVVPSAK